MENKNMPTEESLKESLGNAYLFYCKLIHLTNAYEKEWIYAKSSGWMLKISDNKKSLLYLIPLREEFKINLAIRENEREVFLKDKDLASIHPQIGKSRKYMEGYALNFEIKSTNEYKEIEGLIEKLINIRS
jgi:hypothetical protein